MYLLLVTGLSGAGKSQALNALEDNGFYCVDNLPSELLPEFVRLCERQSPRISKVAAVIDGREYIFEGDEKNCFSFLNLIDVDFEILYLECRDEVIARRYNETRRRHPLNPDIYRGIALEREYLSVMRDRANYILDTSDLWPNDMKREIIKTLKMDMARPFMLSIQSFGYKYGIPFETDMIFDMRFLSNPYYEPSLRHLTGLDAPIIEFLERDKTATEFVDNVAGMIAELIPKYIKQGKHRLMVSFGCTGGMHRSVYAANKVFERLAEKYDAAICHRDSNRWNRE